MFVNKLSSARFGAAAQFNMKPTQKKFKEKEDNTQVLNSVLVTFLYVFYLLLLYVDLHSYCMLCAVNPGERPAPVMKNELMIFVKSVYSLMYE